MPDRNKRVDLTGDLNNLDENILSDVKAATDAVKTQQAADREKEAQRSAKKQSKKISAVLIAVGAVLVLLLSYWVVFGREAGDASQTTPAYTSPAERSRAANPPIKTPCTTKNSGTSSSRVTPGGNDSQSVQHPPDEYEQPWNKPGM